MNTEIAYDVFKQLQRMQLRVLAERNALRRHSLRKILRPSGNKNCHCGRTIAANKSTCLGCSTAKAGAD